MVVIDGCATRCASKLAAEKGIKVSKKIKIADEAKTNNIVLGVSLVLGENELQLAEIKGCPVIVFVEPERIV